MIKTAFYSTSIALMKLAKFLLKSGIFLIKLGKSGEISYSPSM